MVEQQKQSVNKTKNKISGKAPQIDSGPELLKHLIFYYEAFWDLDTERINGFGHGRIPWHSIVAYAMFYGLDDDQTDRLVTHIRTMDLAFLKKLKEDEESRKGK
jgi:hypothetical protein